MNLPTRKTAITLALAVLVAAPLALAGCIGTQQCADMEEGCDFTDHVLTVKQEGYFCPTWSVQFAQYQPTGQSTNVYGVVDDQTVVKALRDAAENDYAVRVWYKSAGHFHQCSSSHPLVVYKVEKA